MSNQPIRQKPEISPHAPGTERSWVPPKIPADEDAPEGPVPRALPRHVDMAFKGLHAEQNDGLASKANGLQQADRSPWMRDKSSEKIPEPECNAPEARMAPGKDSGKSSSSVSFEWLSMGAHYKGKSINQGTKW